MARASRPIRSPCWRSFGASLNTRFSVLLIKNRWNVFKYDDEDAIPAKHKGRCCDATVA